MSFHHFSLEFSVVAAVATVQTVAEMVVVCDGKGFFSILYMSRPHISSSWAVSLSFSADFLGYISIEVQKRVPAACLITIKVKWQV